MDRSNEHILQSLPILVTLILKIIHPLHPMTLLKSPGKLLLPVE